MFNGLYSCFTIHAGTAQVEWSLFDRSRTMPIAGDEGLIQTRAHTNVPRSGATGLPRGWQAWIHQWRSTLNIRFTDGPILNWAANTSVRLHFNDKSYAAGPLLDLLGAPQPVYLTKEEADLNKLPYGKDPMWIRENLTYGVEAASQQGDVDAVKEWLAKYTQGGRILCWIHLDGLVSPSTP